MITDHFATTNLKVNVNGNYAGNLSKSILRNGSLRYSFKYDSAYVNEKRNLALSVNLPKQTEEFVKIGNLHPYFENLVSEGWLRSKQDEALIANNLPYNDEFEILSYFGYDLIGRVSIQKEYTKLQTKICFFYSLSSGSENESISSVSSITSIESSASIPGVQKKILVKNADGQFKITQANELSTHIAKFKSEECPDLIELEYLSAIAVKFLLPEDQVYNVQIANLNELNENALVIERFDRYLLGNCVKSKHFEEFNQLLNLNSEQKYDSSYESMAKFIYQNDKCGKTEVLKLFKRILAFILIGNTDAHLKNFAMFHNDDGSMSLTPIYDIVAVAYYPQFNTLALEMNGTKNLEITQIKPKTIVDLALNKNGFNLTKEQLLDAVKSLEANILNAVHQINSQDLNSKVKRGLVEIMEKRWNGAFKGVQNYLTKRKKN